MKRLGTVVLAILPCVLAGGPAGAQTAFVQEAKLVPPDVARLFGNSASVSGNTALVTAPETDVGSAYVFVYAGGTWTLQQKLVPPDGSDFNYFGAAGAISGDTAIVGDYFADSPGAEDAGAAYVFVRSGTTWTLQQRLAAPDGAALDYFGGAVAVFGDTAVVGAIRASSGSVPHTGAAYVFVRSGTTWSLQRKLTASDGVEGDFFGDAVSLWGDTAIVGANGVRQGGVYVGAGYVFVRAGTNWTQQQVLPAPGTPGTFQSYGGAVAVQGDTAAVADRTRKGSRGAVDVFVRSGTTWTRQQEVTASDPVPGDLFGTSVSLYLNRMSVGAYTAVSGGQPFAGAVYAFERVGTTWLERQRLSAADAGQCDAFGIWASTSPDVVLVGAYAADLPAGDDLGAAYVFRRAAARYFQLATPCRVADTVATGRPLTANSTRTFPVTGLCGVPADATAVAVIPVAVQPNDLGFLSLYPTGHPAPLASTLNFSPNRTRHGNANVALGTGGQLDVACQMGVGSTGTTHFTMDVVGYYRQVSVPLGLVPSARQSLGCAPPPGRPGRDALGLER